MRIAVVVDTNVFVSGIFWSGPPYQILKSWRDHKLDLAVSPAILGEYLRVAFELKTKFPSVDLFPFIELLIVEAKIHIPKRLARQVCQDPEDDKFIECALSAGVKFIISGDRHLLNVSGYEGIQVLKPRDFVNFYL